MTRISYVIGGGAAGVFVGYLLRPSAWLIGQLPFSTVIVRGANLQGMDQILLSTAQQSFNYLVIGAVVGGAFGFLVDQTTGKNKKTDSETK